MTKKINVLADSDLNNPAHEYAAAVVCDGTVILLRHHFADSGDLTKIFNSYLEKKIQEN